METGEWWNLPWVNETCSFYRELEVGLLVRIHHHHGWCVWLMEKMGNVEQITRNPLHVSGVVHHGLVIWSFFRSFLVEFTKCPLVFHALGSWMTFLKLNLLPMNDLYFHLMLILSSFFSTKLFRRGLVMDD